MPYQPLAGDEGMVLVLAALRDYLAADPTIVALLPEGADSIIPEGFFTNETQTPVIMPTVIGDGESAWGNDVQLIRLIVTVLDRGRGYAQIERVLHRMRRRLNDTEAVEVFFTFPPTELTKIWHVGAKGSTASTSFPNWRAEGRGLYVFIEVGGLPASD